MAQDDFGALAIVVDSSIALAANWSLILGSYFGPYLRGLMEQNPGATVSNALIYIS